MTKKFPTGPPISPPDTNPNVAAASPTTTAPSHPYISSKSGAKDPAVPCPPVIDAEPVQRPNNKSIPKSLAQLMPIIFCAITSKVKRTVN